MSKTAFPRTFHILASGLSVALGDFDGFVGLRGHEFTVSEEQYAFTKNRFGVSWLDMSADEQEAKWGVQRFAEGPVPEGMEIGQDDKHGARYRQWMRATEEAQKISNPVDRDAAFRKIKADFPEQNKSFQTSRAY
ncbi:hypothetical protein [Microbacterium alcoholitolerans]|uniref:hypothetical protein n=1 Tax=unclassified Microbacterium TaxID=2609290 RepID=UPI003D1652D8